MKKQVSAKVLVLFALLFTLFTSLACGLDFSGIENPEDQGVKQTVFALQLTQKAIETQQVDVPEADPIEIVANTPTQTDTPESPDVSYEDISFSFDKNIARNIIPGIVQGQNMGEDTMPGETYPTYIDFSFDTYAVSDHFHDPIIRVYPVEEFRIISPYAANVIINLQQTLVAQPAGGSMSDLPFLPMWNAAQLFSAKVEYFDFQNGSGVRYLTMYGQGLAPVDNRNLFYTYQGLTNDGRYYLSAILPVINIGLPNDGSSQSEDYLAFEENWDSYLSETLTWLGEQPPQNFYPNLEELDAMMASFKVNR